MAEIGCLKDGHFNNLEVANTVVMKKNCTNITHSTSLTKSHCGLVFLNGSSTSEGGIGPESVNITLPTSETGLHYKFILNANMASTSASFVISTPDNASFVGSINASNSSVMKTTDGSKKIIFDDGSLPGDFVDINCYSDASIKRWHTFGNTREATGTSTSGVYFN